MKLLYLMHIPWRWIKQRPHFFAEALSDDFEVDVFFKKALKAKKEHLCDAGKQCFKISFFIVLPFDRIRFFAKWWIFDYINSLLVWLQLPKLKSYDYIWVTSVLMYHYVSPFIRNGQKVIYDCMDDELEFPAIKSNPVLSRKIARVEKKLLERADMVFCSAHYLMEKVCKRSGVSSDKFTILNNAIQLPERTNIPVPAGIQRKLDVLESLSHTFVYVGTIAAWFDFDSLLSMLSKNPDANAVLIGPNEVEIPVHERIHYLGTVDRQYIFSFLDAADCLIMPFVVNELIRSVNPVKLYEYIYANKPVLAPAYEETYQFEPYIYLYSTAKEFCRLCSSVILNGMKQKCSADKNLEFVQCNIWDKRYDVIKTKIKSL